MDSGTVARVLNAILGLWLFVSVFLWPDTSAQRANIALVGLFVALTALSAWTVGQRPRLRLINACLGAWLLFSIAAFPPRNIETKINSAIVGVLVFLLALVPQRRRELGPPVEVMKAVADSIAQRAAPG
jgi:hypothetical protein